MIALFSHPLLIMAARALNTAFFVVTSVYCLLTYNPFTYEQFIKPQVSAALTGFAVWHGSIHWLVVSVTALTLAPFLERPHAKWLGWSYLAASLALSAWFFTHPLWLQDGTSPANLILALVCTLPPIWLARFDHVATRPDEESAPRHLSLSDDGRTWTACWMTAAFVSATYAVAALLRLRLTGGIAMPAEGLVLGWIVSALWHLTMFTLVYLSLRVVSGVASLARAPGRTQYWLLWLLSTATITFVLLRVALAPIAIRGAAAWLVSISTGVALASSWSGIAHHRTAGDGTAMVSALDRWLAPIATLSMRRFRLAAAIGLAIAAAAVHLLIARISIFDWEFMLQKLVTLALWAAAFGVIHALAADRPAATSLRITPVAPVAILTLFATGQILLPRLPALAGDARLSPEFAVDSYAAVDPSFRVARDMLGSGTPADAAQFYGYLRAHSTIQREIEPVDIDFVHAWKPAVERPPHVFLFIIDSLRPDYLSPHNKAVTFTPSISTFALDSFVFTRAFSRYAGTGLSVPSIWAGSMLIHKQYATPFSPTNALEKLVVTKGYRRFITRDHLTDDLFEPSPETVLLDRDVPEMLHTFCRTMGELGQKVEAHGSRGTEPIFALTRPLELHIGNIASATVPAGESYPGFHAPYAARVRRIDACFGEFIETLKRTNLYDDSIVVLTSDHGDSLGEGQRWGHGFTAFPEVLRIPLMIHVPTRLRSKVSADLARVSFSTDITPTLYALLGEVPRAHEPHGARDLLLGSPLLVDASTDLSPRRRESYLVASSYGPVYGLISRNGRHLYLADGVESREYAFDLGPDGVDARVGMTDAEREASRRAIRQQIDGLASWYRFDPEP